MTQGSLAFKCLLFNCCYCQRRVICWHRKIKEVPLLLLVQGSKILKKCTLEEVAHPYYNVIFSALVMGWALIIWARALKVGLGSGLGLSPSMNFTLAFNQPLNVLNEILGPFTNLFQRSDSGPSKKHRTQDWSGPPRPKPITTQHNSGFLNLVNLDPKICNNCSIFLYLEHCTYFEESIKQQGNGPILGQWLSIGFEYEWSLEKIFLVTITYRRNKNWKKYGCYKWSELFI